MKSSILFLMAIAALAVGALSLGTKWQWVWFSTALLNLSLMYALWPE